MSNKRLAKQMVQRDEFVSDVERKIQRAIARFAEDPDEIETLTICLNVYGHTVPAHIDGEHEIVVSSAFSWRRESSWKEIRRLPGRK